MVQKVASPMFNSQTSIINCELPIKGIGIDIAQIKRIREVIKSYDKEVLLYLYTKSEVKFCEKSSDKLLYYTICFSCKEAVSKALGTGFSGIKWNEIEVLPKKQAIKINLKGAAKERALKKKIVAWAVDCETSDGLVIVKVFAY